MVAYFDTSLLVGRYVQQEASTSRAYEASRCTDRIIVSDFGLLEASTALRQLAFRKELEIGQLNDVLAMLEADIDAGELTKVVHDWPSTIAKTDAISGYVVPEEGGRTLDLIHLAIAVSSGVSDFFTADKRQAECAKLIGLQAKLF